MKLLSSLGLSLIIGFTFLDSALAETEALREKLVKALLCENDSLDTVHEVSRSAKFASGAAGTRWGLEMDERTVVILENPLELAGGKTSAVIAEFQAPYENFAGIVYSELTGDHQVAVNKLQLRLATGDNEETLGKFVKPVPRPDDADEVCPRTIVLTPLEKGRYLLGCGWCNG